MGIVWSGLAVRVHDVDLHGIVRFGGLVAYFSTWHRDGHVVRLALSEGSPGGAMFGINLRQEAAYQEEKASAKGGKKDAEGWESGTAIGREGIWA